MKVYNIARTIILTTLIAFSFSSCTSDFTDLNTKPSIYAEASADQLFVNVLNSTIYKNTYYYYQSNTVRYGAQYTVRADGADSKGSVSSGSYHFDQLYEAYAYCEQIRSQLDENEHSKRAITYIAQGMLGLRAAKEYGDIPYSEAGQARMGGALFPKYDVTSEIFATIDNELAQAVADIEADVDGEGFDADYDFIYMGDVTKWAKLANVLRLEIAMTIANQDLNRARQICSEVASNSTGLFAQASDEYTFDVGKSMADNSSSLPYAGDGDDFRGALNMQIINMMKANHDPRLSIFALPSSLSATGISYLREVQNDPGTDQSIVDNITALFQVVDTTQKDNPVLTKGDVPEWRFIGASPFVGDEYSTEYGPLYRTFHYLDWDGDMPSSQTGRYVFSYVNKKIMNPDYNATSALDPYFDEQNANEVAGQFVLPIVPYSYMCLLVAQLDYLGIWDNPMGENYDVWYERGVEASIRMYDYIAINHKTNPYNWQRSDAELNDAITNYLAGANVQLTGTGDWEKICIQQYLNCFHLEEFAGDLVMRTGIPAANSTIIRWGDRPDGMGRRTAIGRPTAEEDEANWLEAQKRQNFSAGVSDIITLGNERIWYDIGAPAYGQGDTNK